MYATDRQIGEVTMNVIGCSCDRRGVLPVLGAVSYSEADDRINTGRILDQASSRDSERSLLQFRYTQHLV